MLGELVRSFPPAEILIRYLIFGPPGIVLSNEITSRPACGQSIDLRKRSRMRECSALSLWIIGALGFHGHGFRNGANLKLDIAGRDSHSRRPTGPVALRSFESRHARLSMCKRARLHPQQN